MKLRSSRTLAAMIATLAVVLLTAPALAQEAPSEVVPGTFDGAALATAQAEMSLFLDSETEGLKATGYTVRASAADLERLRDAPTDEGRMLVGVVEELGAPVRFDDLGRRALAAGTFEHANGSVRLAEDSFVFYTTVRAAGASASRLHFTDFFLPRGAEMWVYNQRGEAFGPYVGKGLMRNGDFWTHTLAGSEIHLQVRYEGSQPEQALRDSRFVIADVTHLGESFLLPQIYGPAPGGDATKAFCSFNASCVQNASCSSIPSAIQPAANAVAHIQFNVGSSTYICSGGLLNDTDTSSTIPYFLTANHCYSTSSSASSAEYYFQFTTSCGGSCYNPNGAVPRVVGSTLLATSSTSDYTLVQLNGSAPAGSTLLGWNATAVAFSNGTNLYRLSHPKGAPQAYSRHSVDTSKGTCSSWPRGNWIYSQDTYGATEGGSSGSPVLNSSGQVVGQLSGACGTNPSNPCASSSNATVDGALAAYFSSVDQWLDPSTGGGCHSGSPGSADYCSTSCPCDDGFGDCDSNSECVSGTTCVSNVGPNYGWASWVDVCEGSSGGGPNSCVGNCGSQAPGGCWCDSSCSFYGDCCSDKVAVCG